LQWQAGLRNLWIKCLYHLLLSDKNSMLPHDVPLTGTLKLEP